MAKFCVMNVLIAIWLSGAATASKQPLVSSSASGDLLFSERWEPCSSAPLEVKIVEYPSSDLEGLPTRLLSVSSAGEEIFKFGTPDFPLSVFTYGQRRYLATVWETGSAYALRIYNVENGEIVLIFDTGSDSFPEMKLDEDGHELIILQHGKFKGTPVLVYERSGDQFRLRAVQEQNN